MNYARVLAVLPFVLPAVARAQATETGVSAVVVTATRTPTKLVDVPASVSVLDAPDLRRTGFYAGGDEFRTVPGVSFRRGDGDNDDFVSVSFRGVTGNHGNDTFLALVDGIPFLSPNEEVVLSQVPYAALDRVEVVRGPVSALYGRGGIAGAVNYLTRVPTESGVTIEGAAGTHDYARGSATGSYVNGGVKGLLSLDYENSDGWRESNHRRTTNILGKGSAELGDRADLTLWLNHVDKKYEMGSVIPTRPDGEPISVTGGREAYYGIPDAGRDLNNWMTAARLSYRLTNALEWATTASWRREHSVARQNFSDSSNFNTAANLLSVIDFRSPTTARTGYAESVLRWSTDRNTLTVGGSFERARYEDVERWSGYYGFSFVTFGFYFYSNPIDYRTGAFVPVPGVPYLSQIRVDSSSRQTVAAGFIQDEWRPTDRLTLTMGGRYDHFERDVLFRPTDISSATDRVADDADHFTPKVSTSYRFDPGLLYLTYGQGFSSNFGPTWQWDPNSYTRRTRPTKLDSVELGWKGQALQDRFTYSVAAFHLEQKNRLIYYTSVVGQPQIATSGPPYRSYGLETTAAVSITPTTRLSGNYSYVKAKFRTSSEYEQERLIDPALEDLDGRHPIGVPTHNVNVRLDQRLFSGRVEASLLFEHHGDYFIDVPNTRRAGAYSLVNLGVTVRPRSTPMLELEGTVMNLLDDDYVFLYGQGTDVVYAVPGVPREARLTARVRF